MIEVLEFIFQDFYHWAGTCLLIISFATVFFSLKGSDK